MMRALSVFAVASCLLACSATSTGTGTGDAGTESGSGGCKNFSGSWSLAGSCSETDCRATQTGCTLSVQCGNGTNMSGTVTGSDFQLSGVFGGGNQGSCSGGVNPNSILVSCDGCSATITCSFGACGR